MRLKKELKILKRALLYGLALTIAIGWATMAYADNAQSSLAQSVIRFHVLANSDSDEDQALKLEVRDEILSLLKPELSNSKSIEETRAAIEGKLPEIESDANAFVQARGYNYHVTASLSRDFFPTKTYGDITFFPGEYEALRVVIGSGAGHNWWCVMFPPLCFVDVSGGTVPEPDKQELKSVVKSDYVLLSNQERTDHVTVNVKFKIVEWWQNLFHTEKETEKKLDGYVVKDSAAADNTQTDTSEGQTPPDTGQAHAGGVRTAANSGQAEINNEETIN